MQNGGLGSISLGANEYFSSSANIFTIETGNPATWKYSLPPGSIAINFGISVGLNADFNGKPIMGNPDAGIYEYAPANSSK